MSEILDWRLGVLYRVVYGRASALVDAERYGFAEGRARLAKLTGRDRSELLRGLGELDSEQAEAVEWAIGDAWAGRQPRW